MPAYTDLWGRFHEGSFVFSFLKVKEGGFLTFGKASLKSCFTKLPLLCHQYLLCVAYRDCFVIQFCGVGIVCLRHTLCSGQYLKNGLSDLIQIWHVDVTGPEDVLYSL